MVTRKRWSEEDIAKLTDAYANATPTHEIAELLNRTPSAVRSRASILRPSLPGIRRRKLIYKEFTVPKEWILPKKCDRNQVLHNAEYPNRFYYSGQYKGYLHKRVCPICNTVYLRKSQNCKAIKYRVVCTVCTMEWCENNLLLFDTTKVFNVTKNASPTYIGKSGDLFRIVHNRGKEVKTFFFIGKCMMGCNKPVLISSSKTVKSGVCTSCTRKKSAESLHQDSLAYRNLTEARKLYSGNSFRTQQMLSALDSVESFIPVRAVNVLTLPSFATYEKDYFRLSNRVWRFDTLHWYELPLSDPRVKDHKVHKNAIEGLKNAAIDFSTGGVRTVLHLEDALLSRNKNLGFIHMDMCGIMSEDKLSNFEELIKAGMPPEGFLPIIANFSISRFHKTKAEYIEGYKQWKSKWEAMGYIVPVMKHFPYMNNHTDMFLTAMVVGKPNTD